MSKDTVTIDRRVLTQLLDAVDDDMLYTAARRMAKKALNTARTDEEIMRDGVAAHMHRYCNGTRVLKLTVFPSIHRDSSGMLEWILKYEFESGGSITVGMIQRKPGELVEYHS